MKNKINSFYSWSSKNDCVKSVCIRGYFGPHFPIFELNTERYGVSLRIQSECGKMRTRIIWNTDTYYTVVFSRHLFNFSFH